MDHDRQLAALVGEPVHLRALGHHNSVADAGYAVGEVAQRVLLDQIGDDLRAEGVDVRSHRGVMDEVGGALVEHAGRLAAGVAEDLAAARIGRLEVDSGDRHRRRVGIAGVVRVVHHADRIVGRDIIEFVAREPATVGVSGAVSESPDPLAGGSGLRRCGDGVEDGRFASQRRDATVDRTGFKRRHREVIVGITETGDQGPTAQVDPGRFGADRLANFIAVTDGDNLAVPHRHTGRNPIQPVHRQYAPAGE